MTIGVSREEFYHSTLVELRDWDKVYKNRRMIEDEKALFDGQYTYEAVSIALSNAFRKKNTKPTPYRSKSILAEIEEKVHEQNLTEEEKAERAKAIFAQLNVLKTNFEMSKK